MRCTTKGSISSSTLDTRKERSIFYRPTSATRPRTENTSTRRISARRIRTEFCSRRMIVAQRLPSINTARYLKSSDRTIGRSWRIWPSRSLWIICVTQSRLWIPTHRCNPTEKYASKACSLNSMRKSWMKFEKSTRSHHSFSFSSAPFGVNTSLLVLRSASKIFQVASKVIGRTASSLNWWRRSTRSKSWSSQSGWSSAWSSAKARQTRLSKTLPIFLSVWMSFNKSVKTHTRRRWKAISSATIAFWDLFTQ